MTTEPEGAAAADDYPHPVRAAVLRAVGEPMVVETIHLKTVGPDEVRVRIDQTGVCHSDLSLARGTLRQSPSSIATGPIRTDLPAIVAGSNRSWRTSI